MKCVSDPIECTCDCHYMPNVHHIAPCCVACPHCDIRISFGAEEHIAKCAERKREMERLSQLQLDLRSVPQ